MTDNVDRPSLVSLSQVAETQLTLPDLDAVGLSDLDGWTPADLVAWLREFMPKLAIAERMTDAMRRTTGLFLWRLRQDVGDGQYGETVATIASEVGVSVRTMARWRTEAESHYKLPVPSVRTSAQRERRAVEVESRPAQAALPAAAAAATAKPSKPKPPKAAEPTPAASNGHAPPTDQSYPIPVTAGDVRRLVSLVESLTPTVLRRCIDEPSRLLDLGRKFAEAARPERSASVTPIPKGGR